MFPVRPVHKLCRGAATIRRVVVAMSEARGQFTNPEKREHPPLEAVSREMVKTVTEDTCVCITVICKT